MRRGRIDAYLKHHFRLAWRYYSEARKACLRSSHCMECGVGREVEQKRLGIRSSGSPFLADHREPVVDPRVGFAGWDNYYDRMFNGELQALCKACHDAKTKQEGKVRKATRLKQKETK